MRTQGRAGWAPADQDKPTRMGSACSRAASSKGQGPCSPPVEVGPVPSLGPGSWLTLHVVLASSLPTSQLQKFQASPQRFSLAWTWA